MGKVAEVRAQLSRAVFGGDRVAFALRVGPALGIHELDDWQEDFLRSEHRSILLNCSRQSGKSSLVALLAVHEALFKPGSLVLMVSRTQDHSGELFRKALAVYRAMGRPVPPESETRLSLTLSNGSRIVSRPGATDVGVRGYAAQLLLIDEAARVSDELFSASTPVLSVTGGRVVALSTPFGRRGWWYKEWSSIRDWHRFEVTAEEIDRISPEFLAAERSRKSRAEYLREFFCAFTETEDSFLERQWLEDAVDKNVFAHTRGGRIVIDDDEDKLDDW